MVSNAYIGINLFDYLEQLENEKRLWEQPKSPISYEIAHEGQLQFYNPYGVSEYKEKDLNSSSGNPITIEASKIKEDNEVVEREYKKLLTKEGRELSEIIKKDEFSEHDLLQSFDLFEQIINIYKFIYLSWLIDLYNEVYTNDEYLSRLLVIMAEFADSQDFYRVASLLAKAELNNRSYEVIDAAITIIDNLPSDEARRLMGTINPPQDNLLKIKYDAIMHDLI